ncbi:hypothetical protein AgCh_011833 [Apium graveolens]
MPPIQEVALIERAEFSRKSGKMTSNQSPPLHAIAWLYIDGNIIQNGVDGCCYDSPMSRFVRLDVSFKFKQLCDVVYAKLNIDSRSYGLKIMHRCFNPVTKMFAVAPILDDDDVELMFELVTSLGVKNCVVELYVERVGYVDRGVDVDVNVDVPLPLNSSSEQIGLGCGDLGKRGGDFRDGLRSGKRWKTVEVGRDLGREGGNVEVGQRLGEGGGNVEGSGDLGRGGDIVELSDGVESDGSNKKMFYMERVDTQGKRVSRKGNKGGDSGIPLYRSFDGSFMVASLKEPVFTAIGDVTNVTDLDKGMVFVSRDELADIVSQVHNRNQQEIKVMRADASHWTADCKQKPSGCKWRLTASKRRRHGFFEIMNISGSHTCGILSVAPDNANLQPTIPAEDADANLHLTIPPEDATLQQTITPEDVNLQQTITPEDADLTCLNIEEVLNAQVVDPSV